jgi:hypothetical protein
MRKVTLSEQADVRPIRLKPDDILLITFAKGTRDSVQEATYLGFMGAMRRAGHQNEIVAVTSGIELSVESGERKGSPNYGRRTRQRVPSNPNAGHGRKGRRP